MKDRRTTFRVIDRNTAQCLKRIFLLCYKRGVTDAYLNIHDEGMLREHVEQTGDGRKFGLAGNPTGRWVYWKNRLSDIAEDCNCYKVFNNLVERMRMFGSNYLSVTMIMAQTFYNRGISDYLDNPQADDITLYGDRPKIAWWGEKKEVDCYHLRAYVQDVCSEHIDAIDNGGEDVLKRNYYDTFMQAFSFSIVKSISL